MDDAPQDQTLPPGLRFLKWLVVLLTLTMIGGVITVVAVIVTRMPQGARAPILPDSLQLPQGATAAAVTAGRGWFAVVTTDDHILIFGQDGVLRQTVVIAPAGDN